MVVIYRVPAASCSRVVDTTVHWCSNGRRNQSRVLIWTKISKLVPRRGSVTRVPQWIDSHDAQRLLHHSVKHLWLVILGCASKIDSFTVTPGTAPLTSACSHPDANDEPKLPPKEKRERKNTGVKVEWEASEHFWRVAWPWLWLGAGGVAVFIRPK